MTKDEYATAYSLVTGGVQQGLQGDQQMAQVFRQRLEGIWQLGLMKDDKDLMAACDRGEWLIRAAICAGLHQPCFMPTYAELAA